MAFTAADPIRAQDQTPLAPADTPASSFTDGEARPRIDLQNSPEAREIVEIARLTGEAAQAFDRGEAERGRSLVRQAVQKLAALERLEQQRGNGAGRSRLATQRGRLHLEYLGDSKAAKDSFLDALEADERNEEAERQLLQILVREEAAAGAKRGGGR